MARKRYISPQFFEDEDMAQQPEAFQLAFIGLWCYADRDGRLEDRPKRLKTRIAPYSPIDMEQALTALARGGFIIRYLADGRAYIAIKPSSWAKYQHPHPNETKSVIPAPDQYSVVYASLGDREQIGESLREKPSKTAMDTIAGTADTIAGTTQPCTLYSNSNSNLKEISSEALTRSEPVDDSPIVLTFPTIGKDGTEWHLRTRQFHEWLALYPGLDIIAEAQKALAWVRANENRRKTVRGMPAFLVNWFNRSVNRGGARRSAAVGDKSRLTEQLEKASGQW